MAWKLWENGINHIDRYDRVMGLQIDLTELFEPENFLERIQCIGMEQNKKVESQVRIVATVTTGKCEKCLPVV